jgi:FkbM family methyltransferase
MIEKKNNIEDKYMALAAARREDVLLTKSTFSEQQVLALPNNYPRQIHKLMDAEFEKSFVRDGLGYVVNSRGFVLASEIGIPYHHRMFEALRDKLPETLLPETFLAGLNAAQRFESIRWIPPHIRKNDAKVNSVVEIGAFLGHKAVRFATDYMPANGTYHAIELMEENYEILAANIVANKLQNIVKTHNIGISDADSPIEVFSKGRQRSGIVPISNIGDDAKVVKDGMKLSTFFAAQNVQSVDFCYITVNGAELKVLEGARSVLDSIGFIRIVSKYDVDGHRVAPFCLEYLKDHGFTVSQRRDTIDAINPKVAGDP